MFFSDYVCVHSRFCLPFGEWDPFSILIGVCWRMSDRAGSFFVNASARSAAIGGFSFDDNVADDGIVADSPVQRGVTGVSHLAAVQQTEQSAVEEAKNFTVNCKCCGKVSDEDFFFVHQSACHSFVGNVLAIELMCIC